MKILILNDIHTGQSRESSTHPGIIRQANTQALDTLSKYIDKYNNEKYDLVVNMGDLIRDVKNHDLDLELFRDSIRVYAKIVGKKIFVAGNHELKTLTYSEVEKECSPYDIEAKPTGYIDIDDVRFVWIDAIVGEGDIASISDQSISWLSTTLHTDKMIVLFSHYSVVPLDGKDNFYFDRGYKYMSYTNGGEILELLKNCMNPITINSHTHMSTNKRTGNVSSISALSFTEKIISSQSPEENPGIYSTLEIDRDKRIFRSYSGDFCFLNVEI